MSPALMIELFGHPSQPEFMVGAYAPEFTALLPADFFDSQALHRAKPYGLGRGRIDLPKPFEHDPHGQPQLRVGGGRAGTGQIPGDELGWNSFARQSGPRAVDENLLHRPRRDTEEMFLPQNSRAYAAQLQE